METNSTITSPFGKLNWKDLLRGLIVAGGTAAFTIIAKTLESGVLTFDWKAIAIASGSAALAYLTKNLFTPATVQTPVSDATAEASTLDKTAK